MKNPKLKLSVIFYAISLLLAFAGAFTLGYSLRNCYDAEIQHFASDAPMVIAFAAICIAAVILAAVVFFSTGKKTIYIKNEDFSFSTTFFSVLSACFSIYFGYMTIRNGFEIGKEFLFLLLIAFTFLGAVWFLLDAFGITKKSSSIKLLAFAPALMATFMTSQIYFSMDYAMNSSMKIILILMSISFMLYFIAYCGAVLEAPASARRFTSAMMLSTTIGGSIAMALFVTLITDFSGFNYSLLTSCMYISFWILSSCHYFDFIARIAPVSKEDADGGEITCNFSSEAEADTENKETEDASEENTTEEHEVSEADTSSDEDDGDYYTDEDEGEDIHLPPVKFDDEE